MVTTAQLTTHSVPMNRNSHRLDAGDINPRQVQGGRFAT